MKRVLGTSQMRLNYATDCAESINDTMKRLEFIWQLYGEGALSEEQATNGIKNHIDSLDSLVNDFKNYYSWREDME